MLIYQDRVQLTDGILSPREELARQEEMNLREHAKYKLHRQDELEDRERVYGPRIQFGELISKLRRIAPALKVVDGLPGNVALYYPRNRRELAEQPKHPNDQFFRYHKYVGGFPKKIIPEYGYITIDKNGLQADDVRGWRDVVCRFIESGIVSYKAAVKEFGDANGARSWRWHRALQKHKK